MLGQATCTFTHKTHHSPDSGEATTFPHIVYSAALRRDYIQMALFPGLPSWNSETVPGWSPETLDGHSSLRSGRALNQSCNSHQDLFNDVSHSLRRRQEKVNSRLLVVGSQTGSLTPGPSFSHNLGCRCPNGQCEAISDTYSSRSFHFYKERTKARRFDPSNRLLSFREFRRTPFSHFWECELHSHT